MKVIWGLCGCRIEYPRQAKPDAALRRHYRRNPRCEAKAQTEFRRLMNLWGRGNERSQLAEEDMERE